MYTLIYKGKAPYRGTDPETKTAIQVKPGDSVTVSDAKAKQLFKDYPHDWDNANQTADAPADTTEPADAAPAEDPLNDDLPDPVDAVKQSKPHSHGRGRPKSSRR